LGKQSGGSGRGEERSGARYHNLIAAMVTRPDVIPIKPTGFIQKVHMPTCRQCNGTGREVYDEDDRRVEDACYHCGTTGKVDEDTDFHDRLSAVASTLAYQLESERRIAINNDPDGDGYDLGLMPHDYFRCNVWDRTYEIAEQLAALPISDQEFLVAWHEYERP
jgi:hypothetical protein